MAKIKVGINGFGRIGRAFFKLAELRDDLEVVAINDLGDVENLAYLLKFDSAYGRSPFEVEAKVIGMDNFLVVDGREVKVLSQKDPSQLPWGTMGVDVVVESTGIFEKYEEAEMHIKAGARKVVISAPAKGEPSGEQHATVLMGVNDEKLKVAKVTSNASCTTNAGSPVVAILNETIGIEKAMLSTVHGYTATQSLVDSPVKKDFRRGRAAAQNIIPSTTGAAIATTLAITDLAGKFDGIAIRVPVIVGSLVDLTFLAKRNTTVEEVNSILTEASKTDRWKDIFAVSTEDLVSCDIIGQTYASIVDLPFTRVVDGNLVKVLAWYDNEMGYTNALVEHVVKAGRLV